MARHRKKPEWSWPSASNIIRALRRFLVPFIFIVASFNVWEASNAAFSGTTTNPANSWAVGTVAISDDDGGSSMFAVTGLKPGSTGYKCLLVTYNGTLASEVHVYATSHSTTNALSSHLDLSIQEGDTGNFAGCSSFISTSTIFTGTLATFASTRSNYANGVGSWTPTGAPQTKLYRINYALESATPNTVQGGTAQVTFNWEAQNT